MIFISCYMVFGWVLYGLCWLLYDFIDVYMVLLIVMIFGWVFGVNRMCGVWVVDGWCWFAVNVDFIVSCSLCLLWYLFVIGC